MDKQDIKIDKEILDKTTKCNNSFNCLSGVKECLCKVTGSIGYDMLEIKPESAIDCNYHMSLNNTCFCSCPTRNEIYNRYRK